MARSATRFIISILALLGGLSVSVAQAADSDTDNRLREALRNAIMQQRSLEDERAVLQAKQSQIEKENETLRAQLTEAQKGAAGQKGASAQEVSELQRRIAAQDETIGQLNTALDKWRSGYNEALTVAKTKEAERAKLATDVDGLTQRATGCETKNAELFSIGNEILGRLEKVSLGDVLGAREPFIGFKRVELQNLVQDEQDKLLDQKVNR